MKQMAELNLEFLFSKVNTLGVEEIDTQITML